MRKLMHYAILASLTLPASSYAMSTQSFIKPERSSNVIPAYCRNHCYHFCSRASSWGECIEWTRKCRRICHRE
jgi:hypothetical protein